MTPENQEAVRAVTKLNISFQELTDISGIKWFSGLTNLKCSYNQLTSLDVSANTALLGLWCGNQTSDGTTAQELTVTVTAEQKTKWDNEWGSFPENGNVTVVTK